MKKFQAWIADPRERRRAMIVSTACMLLIALLIAMQTMSPQPAPKDQRGPARFSAPPRPADKPQEKMERVTPRAKKSSPAPAVITPATPVKSAKKPVSVKERPTAQKAARPAYYVQIGAFRERRHARSYMKRMKKQGWTLSIQRKKNGMYAVWVGPWPTPALADLAKKKLGTQHIRGFIVKKTTQ